MTTTKRLYRPRLLDVDYVRAEYAVRSMLLRHGRRVRLSGRAARPPGCCWWMRSSASASAPRARESGTQVTAASALERAPHQRVSVVACRGILRSSAGEWLDAILQFVHIRSR